MLKLGKDFNLTFSRGRCGNRGPAGRNDLPCNHSTIIEELLYALYHCI